MTNVAVPTSAGAPRINWLSGLKGIACVVIFVHHFLLAFYLGSYEGTHGVTRWQDW
ncbi:hypothetical protein [Arcanobacterium bovis]|uniref:hypothetical protein n=1 Tax=Arcanobacterium bovis TaxID=2529275 RepID=UPI0013F14340|nr:hypothetical protein [Arcanobacterium bovis]